jgi:hypothetical protein
MSYLPSYTFTPVIQPFAHRHYDSGNTQSDATIEHEAAQREIAIAANLSTQHALLETKLMECRDSLLKIIRTQQKMDDRTSECAKALNLQNCEIDENVLQITPLPSLEEISEVGRFKITQEIQKKYNETADLQNKLSEVDNELMRAQHLVNARDQRQREEKDAQTVAQTKWNRQLARNKEMATSAIEQAERVKLDKARDEYNTVLEKYQKAARYLKFIQNKEEVKTKIPDFDLGKWTLTDEANKNLIDDKKHNFIAEYGPYFRGFNLDDIVKQYDAHVESVARKTKRSMSPTPTPSRDEATGNQKMVPPSTISPVMYLRALGNRFLGRPPPFGGGRRRSNKKGKKKNRRPNKKCTRRHSKKKSTRRH